MKEAVVISPTDVGKHPKLIRAAQEDMGTMDVLVCGRCLTVFHFVEEFEQHKQTPCNKESSNIRECTDTKPKIWAFLLWKATQLYNNKESNAATPNSWALYQTWVKMDESTRETWIVAGKTIQSFAKVGSGSLQEMPVKITKTVVNNAEGSGSPVRKPLPQTKPQLTTLKPTVKLSANKPEVDVEPPAKSSPSSITVSKKPTIASSVHLPTKATVSNSTTTKPLGRRITRTTANSEEDGEENVEKIVAKRFNPRRKMHEYLVKWEGRSHEQNTWESASNLESVPQLLEIFEKQLARQKEQRAALQAKQLVAASAKSAETNKVAEVKSSENSRPSRTSKIKAMDQVKQWVAAGNNSAAASPSSATDDTNPTDDNEKDWSNDSSGIKRKLEDDDYNDENAGDLPSTTATMEDLEEDLIPSHTVKRLKNGNAVTVESKGVKVNGTTSRPSSLSGESSAAVPSSAEVIITQDSNTSGVMKRPGFTTKVLNTKKTEAQIRIISKGESAVSNTGIVRVGNSEKAATIGQETKTRTPLLRSGNQTSVTTVGSTQISTVRPPVQRTPGGTIIQRKTISTPAVGTRTTASTPVTTSTPTRSAVANSAPASGRMIIPRSSTSVRPANPTKTVTPEQKILQLSKSGDLKVTKKVMTREDAVAQRLSQQRQQQLRQQQSQVQIQKVQQIAPPTSRTSSTVTVRKHSDSSSYSADDNQGQLCPITGKIIGQDDQPSGVLQTQVVTDQQQLTTQQEQQQLQDIDPNLLLSSDQQVLTNEDGSPLLVTGEDGTVYQVAGKNAEGQTILVTQGPDGEQQFAYVASPDNDENQVLTLDNAVAEAVAQLPADQQSDTLTVGASEGQYLVKTTQEDGTTQVVTMSESELAQHQALAQTGSNTSSASGQLCIQTGDPTDGQEANIPAEVVQADLPSPGGTRRVVLMLQDGTFMMTEMHDDEFKALNIAT